MDSVNAFSSLIAGHHQELRVDMSGWYYAKEGALSDEQLGPFDDAAFLKLAYDGTLNAKSKVNHETHTNGAWTFLEQVPAAMRKVEEGKTARLRQAGAERQARNVEKRQKEAEKEEQRRVKAEQEEQQRILDNERRVEQEQHLARQALSRSMEENTNLPPIARIALAILWCTLLVGMIGAVGFFIMVFMSADSAIQEASVSATFATLFVAAYIMARCIEKSILAIADRT